MMARLNAHLISRLGLLAPSDDALVYSFTIFGYMHGYPRAVQPSVFINSPPVRERGGRTMHVVVVYFCCLMHEEVKDGEGKDTSSERMWSVVNNAV